MTIVNLCKTGTNVCQLLNTCFWVLTCGLQQLIFDRITLTSYNTRGTYSTQMNAGPNERLNKLN